MPCAEAKDRVGGRTSSIKVSHGERERTIDLGGQWAAPSQTRLLRYSVNKFISNAYTSTATHYSRDQGFPSHVIHGCRLLEEFNLKLIKQNEDGKKVCRIVLHGPL